MVPDQRLILNYNPRSGAYQMAMMSKDKDLIFVYNPYGYPLKIDVSHLEPNKLNAFWFNPRDGEYLYIKSIARSYDGEFTPHSIGRGSDWVLILQDASKDYNEFTQVK